LAADAGSPAGHELAKATARFLQSGLPHLRESRIHAPQFFERDVAGDAVAAAGRLPRRGPASQIAFG